MFISFVTAFFMNVLITRPLLQQIRLNFRRRLDQVGSAELFSRDGNVRNDEVARLQPNATYVKGQQRRNVRFWRLASGVCSIF